MPRDAYGFKQGHGGKMMSHKRGMAGRKGLKHHGSGKRVGRSGIGSAQVAKSRSRKRMMNTKVISAMKR